ncbi:DNA replication/repair protein RecF [Qipengyuania sp.]|uniref:DNA replication/repair protein RecF n=1 Tax=Qipengyuania sp. TaxID=2004515 RepID=UPI0035C7C5D6
MALARITLTDFRNHRDTTFDGAGGFNLLVGPNGAGKTNVLEAISLLSPGRGLRRAQLGELAGREGTGGFAVGATLAAEGAARIGTAADPAKPNRRRVRINGADTSASALAEWLAVGWLTPAMDGLFTASAGERRRYLDRLALGLEPRHASKVARYEAALRERNRLLSDQAPPDPQWMDAIETQMAQAGGDLAEGRSALVDVLMGEIVRHGEESFPRPALTYRPGGPTGHEELSQALHEGRARDRAAGRTLTGPHRDDLEVFYAAKQRAAAQSSTGEQKALLIAITLAHAALSARGRPAVLLLDEVAAHLDPDRRAALFERLEGAGIQVWVTGTERAPFSSIADRAAIWDVRAGTASRL